MSSEDLIGGIGSTLAYPLKSLLIFLVAGAYDWAYVAGSGRDLRHHTDCFAGEKIGRVSTLWADPL